MDVVFYLPILIQGYSGCTAQALHPFFIAEFCRHSMKLLHKNRNPDANSGSAQHLRQPAITFIMLLICIRKYDSDVIDGWVSRLRQKFYQWVVASALAHQLG